jgi:hypothetical protein
VALILDIPGLVERKHALVRGPDNCGRPRVRIDALKSSVGANEQAVAREAAAVQDSEARVSHVLKGFGDMTERLLKSAPYRATTCGGSASRATLRTPANS